MSQHFSLFFECERRFSRGGLKRCKKNNWSEKAQVGRWLCGGENSIFYSDVRRVKTVPVIFGD